MNFIKFFLTYICICQAANAYIKPIHVYEVVNLAVWYSYQYNNGLNNGKIQVNYPDEFCAVPTKRNDNKAGLFYVKFGLYDKNEKDYQQYHGCRFTGREIAQVIYLLRNTPHEIMKKALYLMPKVNCNIATFYNTNNLFNIDIIRVISTYYSGVMGSTIVYPNDDKKKYVLYCQSDGTPIIMAEKILETIGLIYYKVK